MSKKKVLLCFGTRPEAIKFAPVVREFAKRESFDMKVCVTAQHRSMLDQVTAFFRIKPDYDLEIMTHGQSLFHTTSIVLQRLEPVIRDFCPDVMLVQGDTTTAFVGALASFYQKVKVGHIEAGLRSGHMFSPFPEEANRILVSKLANYHFAPTDLAASNLAEEGIENNVYTVGNTVVDALFLTMSLIEEQKLHERYEREYGYLDNDKRLILVTGHRRESFGKPFEQICCALKEIASIYKDVEIVYPVHLNPNVRKPVFDILKDASNVHLIEPLDYPRLIWLLSKSFLVLTDSGGIQEEAPSLGKPVLVMRDVTERTEGVDAGTASLVGTNPEKIISSVSRLLTDKVLYAQMSRAQNPYGDGKSAMRITDILERECL